MNRQKQEILETLEKGIDWIKKTIPVMGNERMRQLGEIDGLEKAKAVVESTDFDNDED